MNQKLEKPEVKESKNKMANKMRDPFIAKVTLSCGAVDKDLEKSAKLLEMLGEGRKAQIIKSGPKRRIPAFSVKPNMPLGTRVTVRGEKAIALLKKLLSAIDNQLKKKQVEENTFSFGIAEYIEIPGTEYVREIGIRGLNVTVTFERAGIRVKRRKIKRGKLPRRQHVTKEDIFKFMEEKFKTSFV
jgi:large subunit ribosomal protein L5